MLKLTFSYWYFFAPANSFMSYEVKFKNCKVYTKINKLECLTRGEKGRCGSINIQKDRKSTTSLHGKVWRILTLEDDEDDERQKEIGLSRHGGVIFLCDDEHFSLQINHQQTTATLVHSKRVRKTFFWLQVAHIKRRYEAKFTF